MSKRTDAEMFELLSNIENLFSSKNREHYSGKEKLPNGKIIDLDVFEQIVDRACNAYICMPFEDDLNYILDIYKKLDEYTDLKTLFFDITDYFTPYDHSVTFNVIPHCVEKLYDEFKNTKSKDIRWLVSDLIYDDFNDICFSLFKELYEKQNTNEEKLDAILFVVSVIDFINGFCDGAYEFEREGFIEFKEEFITGVDKFYFK